jgi:hypothetical protein
VDTDFPVDGWWWDRDMGCWWIVVEIRGTVYTTVVPDCLADRFVGLVIQ